ncbi:cytochrome P450 [Glycomyces artemisiae]|uniref:Cytochrome P450 n=1 Tax=Glycomyces artemisiae TaxID=1076443 RepID=A0A2T0UPB2_9ACTN|nr:cytochrome P450 [Glycomyces artemisiae]PRY59779.1 cytochrome P450 [Glycomyces artemisiae]
MIPSLPTERPADRPFDPPPALHALPPLARMRYPDGHEGWLATSHAVVRDVLADRRFSSRTDLRHLPIPGLNGSTDPAPPGALISLDPPDHTRYRRVLAGKFTTRRMRLLSERVRAFTEDRLDAMAEQDGPVDLIAALAFPVPAEMIGELLGIPQDERAEFERESAPLFRLGATREELQATSAVLFTYLSGLVTRKREDPTDDLLSDLVHTDLTDQELVMIAFLLLGAGLDTTSNMIGMGAFALLANPDQLALLRAEPGSITSAVEELMRYLSVVPVLVRTALEDIELHGETIKAGEAVTVSIPAANHDPEKFPDPDRLDLRRNANGHVGFGHGIHQCLGQQLARVELEVVLSALFSRFPDLRLAVPPEQVPLRTDMVVYGVHELPVDWKA